MKYFYEHDNLFRNIPVIYYPDASGLIRPLIKSPAQISVLEWEIIDELYSRFAGIFYDTAWSLYFKYPTVLSAGKYVFSALLVLAEPSADSWRNRMTVLKRINFSLREKYAFIHRVSVKFLTEKDLGASRNFQFLVKVIYYRVTGVDFESKFEGFTIGNDSIQLLPRVPLRIEEFKQAVESSLGVIKTEYIVYMVKLLIRSAFELVLEKENFFTRDLDQCYASFCKYYPSYAGLSGSLLSSLRSDIFRMDDFLKMVDEFGGFLTAEYEKILIPVNDVTGKN